MTPYQARELIRTNMNMPIYETSKELNLSDAILNLANQVERLEAQRKQLREALSMVRDYVVTMKGNGHDYQIAIDDALKATE